MTIQDYKDRIEANDAKLLSGIESYSEKTKTAGEQETEFMSDLLLLKEASNMFYSALCDIENKEGPVNENDLKELLLTIDEFFELSKQQLEGI